MKYFASLAALIFFAAAQNSFAEDQQSNGQPPKKKPAPQHHVNTTAAVHNTQLSHQPSFNTSATTRSNNNITIRNPYLYGGRVHHTPTLNQNVTNQIQQQQNVANAAANANAARKWKGKNWQNDPKWQANANWQYNQARWSNYRNFERRHHDRDWWRSRYSRFALFGGGYYYWNNGFWYPAYGYDPYYTTYSYDAPIYSYNDQDPGQVIGEVQNALQQAGYDPGPIDGTYGPATRDALLRYQTDNGLPRSGEIDQPTLESLGLQ